MLSICVLGSVVVRRDGTPVRIPAGKASELLVRLAVEPGVAVRSERLLDDLWGDEAATTRPNTLQSKVAMLRRALGAEAVVATGGGYALTVDLAAQTVTRPDGVAYPFEVDAFRKHCLLHGLDDIGLTLQESDAIRAYEARHRAAQPWLFGT